MALPVPAFFRSKWLLRTLMIGPPLVFLVYSGHSVMMIRELLTSSTSFHMDYANNLVQDYLEMELSLDLDRLRLCQRGQTSLCEHVRWVSEQASGPVLQHMEDKGKGPAVYLDTLGLAKSLPTYIASRPGLSSLFFARYHEPVYWIRIFGPEGTNIYESGARPTDGVNQIYPLDRSLQGYQMEVVYNSFGTKQLFSVAKSRINFGLILLLFILAVFSIFLITRAIRQKLLLAKQKSFFVNTVSHEFKTPLAIMKLAAETLESKRYNTAEQEQHFLRMINNEINRLNHLVHTVLNFNKMEMGQFQIHLQDQDLREVLERSLGIFQVRAQEEQVTLAIEISQDPLPVRIDPDMIRHAVDNLLDNAFKYRGNSNRVEIRCLRNALKAELHICDFGIGIAKEEIPLIQKSFYRAGAALNSGIRGSGLGLAVTRFILEQMDGELIIQSELGKGSTFSIRFPILDP